MNAGAQLVALFEPVNKCDAVFEIKSKNSLPERIRIQLKLMNQLKAESKALKKLAFPFVSFHYS